MSAQPQGKAQAQVPSPPAGGAHFITLADQVRKWGLLLLLWVFVGTAALSLATVLLYSNPGVDGILPTAANNCDLALTLADRPFEHLKQILQILLPAETALLGSAMGFYYGSQAKAAGG